jgi:hypothetical protein
MRIEVTKPGHDGCREKKVNIRVPVAVLRSGLKPGSLMRGFKDDRWGGRWSERLKARGLDIDFDHFDTASSTPSWARSATYRLTSTTAGRRSESFGGRVAIPACRASSATGRERRSAV